MTFLLASVASPYSPSVNLFLHFKAFTCKHLEFGLIHTFRVFFYKAIIQLYAVVCVCMCIYSLVTTTTICNVLFRITPRKFDMVPACDPQSSAHTTSVRGTNSSLTLNKRGTRTSFTFRKIRHDPCHCGENVAGAQWQDCVAWIDFACLSTYST